MIWGPGQSLTLFVKSCISVVLRPLQKLGMSKRPEYTGLRSTEYTEERLTRLLSLYLALASLVSLIGYFAYILN